MTSRRGRSKFLAFALIAAALAGCFAEPVRPGPYTDRSVVLPMPIILQEELHECGLIALTSLCRFHGRRLAEDQRTLLAEVAREREGLSGAELCEALNALGMDTWLFEGRLGRGPTGAYDHLDAGRPLLVMITAEREAHHYCILAGYDPLLELVYLFDPRLGHVSLPAATFERRWSEAGHFTLLALPRDPSAPVGAAAPPAAAPRMDGAFLETIDAKS